MKFSKSFIVIMPIIALFFSYPVQSQDQDIEEVIVYGKAIKESQQAAIEAKRSAPNLAEVISADAIGRFPDVNLSDSLGRLPGISIERDQGQARYVSFRGTPKRYTTTAFNGINIPGVENGRIPRFDSYPTVITSQVVANKAITSDMPGESISGFINIKTFKPSDVDGWSFAAEIGKGEQDQGSGDISKENLRTSYSNDDFGFVVYVSSSNVNQITDNREPTYGGTKGAQTPNRIDYRSYKVERESEAFGGTFEKYLENGGRIFLTSLNTEFTDNEVAIFKNSNWGLYRVRTDDKVSSVHYIELRPIDEIITKQNDFLSEIEKGSVRGADIKVKVAGKKFTVALCPKVIKEYKDVDPDTAVIRGQTTLKFYFTTYKEPSFLEYNFNVSFIIVLL